MAYRSMRWLVVFALSLPLGCRCGGKSGGGDEASAGDDGALLSAEARRRRDAIDELRVWEDATRAETDFAGLPPWSEASGANPFRIREVDGVGIVGLLRGTGELVVLSEGGAIERRVPTFVDATGWDVAGEFLYVVGPRQGAVARYRIADGLTRAPDLRVAGAVSLREIAIGPQGQVAVAEAYHHQIRVGSLPGAAAGDGAGVGEDHGAGVGGALEPSFTADCSGALDVQWAPGRLLALCPVDHRVLAWTLDADGMPTGEPMVVEHDGPIWSMAAREVEGGTIRLALGGVEDRALDRSDGAFGYVDSFVFVVDLPGEGEGESGAEPQRRAALDTSAHGLVTPKHLVLDETGQTVTAFGYATDTQLTIQWPPDFGAPTITEKKVWPGITDATATLAASPLMDGWVTLGAQPQLVPVPREGDDRSAQVRLGEALAFTTLMGPYGRTEGKASIFTCETCHFEGGVDGRVHWTGRGEVFASTRSIRGLFNNRPHFSRALDRSMADMVDNEFRVVSKGTGGDPWFTLSPEDAPWLRDLGVEAPVDAVGLRRALMAFLMTFTHEPNPRVLAGPRAEEIRELEAVLELFERRCEKCHSARLVADDPDSRVPREQWLRHILSEQGAIVWGSGMRHRTGVEPYVHEEGARVPSLRRVFAKRPYFTNGSAKTLPAAVRAFSFGVDQHVEDAAGGRAPTRSEQRALLDFLEHL